MGIGYSGLHLTGGQMPEILKQHRVFSGGDRHYTIVKAFLPGNHCWIPVKGNMEEVIQAYEQVGETVVIFASGDPYFFGFGNTLKRLRPEAKVRSFPYFNCIQLLSHQVQFNYSEISIVSVHGRSWDKLDEALVAGSHSIGVLTDQQKSPAAVAKRLLEYGFTHYRMILGEELESPDQQINTLSLHEAAVYESKVVNCLILEKTGTLGNIGFGIKDDRFASLPGRPGMITKRPVRLTTISTLELGDANVFWDVGSCTGSIAIEAKRLFPALKTIAFEKRTECESIIRQNMRKFQCPGVQLEIGDVFEMDLEALPKPDTLFIGGHGNRLAEMIRLMDQYLRPGGRMLMNTVKEDSANIFFEVCRQLGYQAEPPVAITVDTHNQIKVLSACKAKKRKKYTS